MDSEASEKLPNKAERKSPLAMTAEDHRAIGSTPPEILQKNLGKTMAELMTDEEILLFLEGLKNRQQKITEGLARLPKRKSWEHLALQTQKEANKDNFKLSLKYLEEINRLPKEFSPE